MKTAKSFPVIIYLILFNMLITAGFISAQNQTRFNPEMVNNKKVSDIANIVPYIGFVRSEYSDSDYNLDETDSALMKGLYLQWIRPGLFQVNSFIYGADDLNNEDFTGFHLMGDLYINHPENGRYVIGSGIELLKPDFSTTISSPGLVIDAEITNTIIVPFIRAGRYFDFEIGNSSALSILQWAGYQLAFTRGEADILFDFDPPFPPDSQSKEEISSEKPSMLLGAALSLNLMRFIGIDIKYKAVMDSEDYFNVIEGMGNIYFTRNTGFSVRYKYAETANGYTTYTIYGIIISF